MKSRETRGNGTNVTKERRLKSAKSFRILHKNLIPHFLHDMGIVLSHPK